MLKIQNLALYTASLRKFHSTPAFSIDQNWRRKMKLSLNPNTESPLTCLPDFTYMDGRPTPLGKNQKKRLLTQREITSKIIEGVNEINFAVERFKQLNIKSELEKRNALDSKLKMKGFKMLKS